MSETVIQVENLSKRYRIGGNQDGKAGYSYGSLRDSLAEAAMAPINYLRKRLSDKPFPQPNEIWALKDVSFEVYTGDTLGIIGRNGAGKSTLLKVLSRITRPTQGRVTLHGRVSSLLEVGTGFHPELTGRENIYLNSAILGMRRSEIERKFDEIVDFAEIEQFLDTPVKFYSSGMYMRLAFAVAAHLEPEILLVDEVLAVGDAQFQKKCLGKMGEVASAGRTVLFVSHNMGAVKSLCHTAIYLDSGVPRYHGEVSRCIDAYLNSGDIDRQPQVAIPNNPDLPIQLLMISIVDEADELVIQHPYDRPLWLKIVTEVRHPVKCYIAVHIHDSDLNTLLFSRDFESRKESLDHREPGRWTYHVEIPGNTLVPGMYRVSVHLAEVTPPRIIQRADYICPFEIIDIGSIRAEMGFPWRGKVATPLPWTSVKVTPQ
jgi:lipopolysaccharide transport system ATP-binding protein